MYRSIRQVVLSVGSIPELGHDVEHDGLITDDEAEFQRQRASNMR